MKAHEAIIRIFESEGIEDVFALMSEDTMGLLTTVQNQWGDSIELTHSRHEQGAMAMADAYSRIRDDVGVCIVGRGPAVAQTGTSLVTARKHGSKLLVLVPEPALDTSYSAKMFQQETFLESTIGDVISIRSHDRLASDLNEAFRRVRGGDGPVAVQIPYDLMDSELPESGAIDDYRPTTETVPTPSRTVPDDNGVAEAASVLSDSEAPIVLAGMGAVCSNAKREIRELAKRSGALIATTLQARGYFDEDLFHVGFIGGYGHELANEYVQQSDAVLAVGCTLNPYTTNSGRLMGEGTTLVHVDTDASNIGRHTNVDHGVVGDATITIEAIMRELETDSVAGGDKRRTDATRQRIAETSPFDQDDFEPQPDRLDPQDLIEALDGILPEDRTVVTDAGHFACWIFDGLSVPHPDEYLWTANFGAIGQGLPMGVGAARASDERPCYAFCGDAGFMMALQELETAARNDIPLTVFVMNDSALGAEYHRLIGGGQYGGTALIDTPELEAVAESLGADGYTVCSRSDLAAIEDKLRRVPDGPRLVECKMNRNARHRSRDKI
jgi:thiamine pyrophosphate-dependent acetolactate synthase large subunit-like protein